MMINNNLKPFFFKKYIVDKTKLHIFPVKLDSTDPYGFLRHIQAITFNGKTGKIGELAERIEKLIFDKQNHLRDIALPKLNKIVERLKNNFLNSTNTVMAESVLNQLMAFKPGKIKKGFIDSHG